MVVAPDLEAMIAQERLDEVAAILAAGLGRLRRRQAGERRFSAGNCLEVPPEMRPSVTVEARKGDIACN